MNKLHILILLPLLGAIGLISGCSDDESTATSVSGTSANSGSLGASTPTGNINAAGFFILYDPAVPDVFDSDLSYTQQESTITIFADDVNDLVELSGHTVNFRTEWGSFVGSTRDACVLENGSCSVTWRSGDPDTAPSDCRVAITAWANGEESFFDANDNGLFDQSEGLYDIEEPFLSINTNVNDTFDETLTTFEGIGELIDIIDFDGRSGHNYSHDSGDLEYTGTLCASGNTRCSGRTSMIIHYRSNLLIQSPFTDSDDLNGNSLTDDEINLCNFSFY